MCVCGCICISVYVHMHLYIDKFVSRGICIIDTYMAMLKVDKVPRMTSRFFFRLSVTCNLGSPGLKVQVLQVMQAQSMPPVSLVAQGHQ